MELSVRPLETPAMDARPIEVVERKGLGHPDSICDALAEELSLAYSRFALARFGAIPHHNVDKVLLRAGRSAPRFGGGELLEPIEIWLAGRATLRVGAEELPVREAILDALDTSVYERVELTRDVHRRAEQLLLTLTDVPLRAADALHVALAISRQAASMLSFDARLGAAARVAGLAVYP